MMIIGNQWMRKHVPELLPYIVETEAIDFY